MLVFFGEFFKILSLNFWDDFVSQLLIELESSSKNQKNPHGQLVWGGITFQSSIYDSFPLKPGCVENIPLTETISVPLSLFKIQ